MRRRRQPSPEERALFRAAVAGAAPSAPSGTPAPPGPSKAATSKAVASKAAPGIEAGRVSPPPSPRSAQASDPGIALFRALMADVAPLGGLPRPRTQPKRTPVRPPPPIQAPAAAAPPPAHVQPKPPPKPARATSSKKEPAPGRFVAPAAWQPRPAAPIVVTAAAPGLPVLDRLLRARLARGRMLVERRLDLHGLTEAAAHQAVGSFLRAAAAEGLRTVLIITGRGERRPEHGVLRRQLPLWLEQPGLAQLVEGVSPAERAHGGVGAYYVRLRRIKAGGGRR